MTFQQMEESIQRNKLTSIEGETSYDSYSDLKKKIANFEDPFSRLEIRVGKITFIQDHVMASKRYINQVRYDGADDRKLKAAIAKIKGPYKKKTLKKRKVVIVINVRYKVKHIESESFILYARDDEKNITELLDPPPDSEVGDRIIAPGIPFIPTIEMPYIKPNKEGKRLLDRVTADMRVDAEGFATYKGIRLQTFMEGMITVPTARECSITR